MLILIADDKEYDKIALSFILCSRCNPFGLTHELIIASTTYNVNLITVVTYVEVLFKIINYELFFVLVFITVTVGLPGARLTKKCNLTHNIFIFSYYIGYIIT